MLNNFNGRQTNYTIPEEGTFADTLDVQIPLLHNRRELFFNEIDITNPPVELDKINYLDYHFWAPEDSLTRTYSLKQLEQNLYKRYYLESMRPNNPNVKLYGSYFAEQDWLSQIILPVSMRYQSNSLWRDKLLIYSYIDRKDELIVAYDIDDYRVGALRAGTNYAYMEVIGGNGKGWDVDMLREHGTGLIETIVTSPDSTPGIQLNFPTAISLPDLKSIFRDTKDSLDFLFIQRGEYN